MKKVGLALGGGGAKGLAHIPLLQVFDDLDIRPHRVTGTSIGSIVGSLYCAGLSAERIRAGIDRMIFSRGDSFRHALRKRDVLRWLEFMDVDFSSAALFKGDKFINFLYENMHVSTFEELEIPLRVVATDFWESEQVILESGDLLSAVKASMGLPGVFTPVVRDGRVLIDGGGVNPVPYDLLEDCDLVVAIDVMGDMAPPRNAQVPNLVRAVLGTFDIMQNSIIAGKLMHSPPDIYIKPDIVGVDILEFFKADDVYEQAGPACDRLRTELEQALSSG